MEWLSFNHPVWVLVARNDQSGERRETQWRVGSEAVAVRLEGVLTALGDCQSVAVECIQLGKPDGACVWVCSANFFLSSLA